MTATSQTLMALYDSLLSHFGPQKWWPADTPFEVMVGAILTQNTSWKNVEKAIAELKKYDALNLDAMRALPVSTLAAYIRSAGYFNIKAARLKALIQTIDDVSAGDLDRFLALPLQSLREALLQTRGIGPETADSIVLYAAHQPIFVVDTYTKRILVRHKLIDEDADYYAIQDFLMTHLEEEVALFNEYHALIVRAGNGFCKPKEPHCDRCPLRWHLSCSIPE